jgi:hypothetical protein
MLPGAGTEGEDGRHGVGLAPGHRAPAAQGGRFHLLQTQPGLYPSPITTDFTSVYSSIPW